MDLPAMRAAAAVLFLGFLAIASIDFTFCSGNSIVSCIGKERQALLQLKEDLKDPSSRLSSWNGNEDCCSWDGVVCDSFSGHVLELHLQSSCSYCKSQLGGKISPSLLNLKHLSYLNLSSNDFGEIKIPDFIGFLKSLRYLDLSGAGFSGAIPQTLGNLSSLRYLNLHHSYSNLRVENFQWVSDLLLLQHLDLTCVNLNQASDWLQVTSMLPSLAELRLSRCQLHPPSVLDLNFTSLPVLDLSDNYFKPLMPNWLFSLTTLDSLILQACAFTGPIPSGLQNMTSLRDLDLSFNHFNSTIPNWLYSLKGLKSLNLGGNELQGLISSDIGNMTSITYIDLSLNKLEGRIPRSMGTLCNAKVINMSANKFGDISDVFRSLSGCILDNLEMLILGECQLSGSLTDHDLEQFKNLQALYLFGNSTAGPIPWSLGRLSSLRFLNLAGNQLNGTVPESLGHLKNLEVVLISYNLLEGVVSEAHFAHLTNLKVLYASNNPLILEVSSDWSPPFQLEYMEMRSCHLGPRFPNWLHSQKKISYLDISNSGISDTIPPWFWNFSSGMNYLNLTQPNPW